MRRRFSDEKKVRVTVTIDPASHEAAKFVAQHRKESLSGMLETYLLDEIKKARKQIAEEASYPLSQAIRQGISRSQLAHSLRLLAEMKPLLMGNQLALDMWEEAMTMLKVAKPDTNTITLSRIAAFISGLSREAHLSQGIPKDSTPSGSEPSKEIPNTASGLASFEIHVSSEDKASAEAALKQIAAARRSGKAKV